MPLVVKLARLHNTSLSLTHKHLLICTLPLALFGPRFQRLDRWLFRAQVQVFLSDGDEGLWRLRQQLLPQAYGLLDRWHLAQAVRAFTGPDQTQFRRLMQPLWEADIRAALQALSSSPLRLLRPQAFEALFGYLYGHRDSIDAWRRIPARLRRGRGRRPPTVKSGSGAVEKNIEVRLNRRFKGQGRSWPPERAERLLALQQLLADPAAWAAWWKAPPQFHVTPKPP